MQLNNSLMSFDLKLIPYAAFARDTQENTHLKAPCACISKKKKKKKNQQKACTLIYKNRSRESGLGL